jgi:long-chain acyl-CoA synthetase
MVFSAEDVHFSYLPLAHSFERLMQAIMFLYGAQVGFFQGDRTLLLSDLKKLRPTFFATVPRVLNRAYDKVMTEVNSSYIKKTLFGWALSSKQKELRRGVVRNNSWWDLIVFRKIQVRALLSARVYNYVYYY